MRSCMILTLDATTSKKPGGPRTLNGLILEYLQDIPDANISIRIGDYLIEILQVKDNMVKAAKVRHASNEPEAP